MEKYVLVAILYEFTSLVIAAMHPPVYLRGCAGDGVTITLDVRTHSLRSVMLEPIDWLVGCYI